MVAPLALFSAATAHALLLLFAVPHAAAFAPASTRRARVGVGPLFSAPPRRREGQGQVTELPDSLDDAARTAAECTVNLISETGGGPAIRCRVDFDTTVGDETFTVLKASTEFCQKYLTDLSYLLVPDFMRERQAEMMRNAEAGALLRRLQEDEAEGVDPDEWDEKGREAALETVRTGGRRPWEGPTVRVYFPDEGSAALARRDWTGPDGVPRCVAMSSLGGMGAQGQDVSKDVAAVFFCPRASESGPLEGVLGDMEARTDGAYVASILINPVLVDMSVTGFGMAGRLLRERLIDGLVNVYYLRTLPWGALTRSWPKDFGVWQEDEASEGGYRLIKALDVMPSNPEVEDIYDIENGLQDAPKEGFGLLNAIGDFAQGMMRM